MNLKSSVISLLVLAILYSAPGFTCSAQEITHETLLSNNASRPGETTFFYRKGVKILSIHKTDEANVTYDVYCMGQPVAKLRVTSHGVFKEALLGDQMSRAIAVQWVDRNGDGRDELLLVSSVDDSKILEAFLISPTNVLIPIVSSKFDSLLTPRAQPVPEADVPPQ